MIHASAQDAQEIAQLLRGEGDVSNKINAAKIAARLLGNKFMPGIVVTAPRQSGKTTELLRYAEETNPNGRFIIVCPNHSVQHSIGLLYWELMGKKVVSPTPPLMLTPVNFNSTRGQKRPIYVDEWSLIPEATQHDILDSGLFVAAVTT